MKQSVSLSDVEFGEPEAEHDSLAIQRSFYEAASWRTISSNHRMPFVVGRKGSGKSAIAARFEYLNSQSRACCFLRIIPANFRHVEIRDLLACLVNRNATWQYIYRKVWEGIILGQVVRHSLECPHIHNASRFSPELAHEVERFQIECGFYVAALGDALSDVISNHVRDASKKTDALSQVDLRRKLQPYAWEPLVQALQREFSADTTVPGLFIAIDGLDEHWDTSAPSLYFLAELLAVAKNLTAALGPAIRFLICLRDSIFRALVDTRSIEYDKIESLVINLEWNSRSLFELIARRVSPHTKLEHAVAELRNLLPETVSGVAVEDYIARQVLQRPRDYVNFFRMLQRECRPEPRAGEGHIEDAVGKYSANRLVDLENEFGFVYPAISKCIAALHTLPLVCPKELLLERLAELLVTPSFRAQAPELLAHYGQPDVLARILLSIGVVGTYDSQTHSLRFVHEFSESRVSALWESSSEVGVHPVYCHQRTLDRSKVQNSPAGKAPPAIVSHPADYLAEKDDIRSDLEPHAAKMLRRREDILASFAAIDKGQEHFRRFELWVDEALSVCFLGDLVNSENQITTRDGSKRFEIIFDIAGQEPPWPEIKEKYLTHRLLVECKNTDDPTDADFSKLARDMEALDVQVAFMAYRGTSREPSGKVLSYQRGIYVNSKKQKVILTMSDVFIRSLLKKKSVEKCRANLNALWRDHVHRYLPS